MVDLWRDFWIRETGTGQQVAQLHDRYMMMISQENFPTFYGTHMFITFSTTVHYWSLSPASISSTLRTYLFKIHSNIILPTFIRPSKSSRLCVSTFPYPYHVVISQHFNIGVRANKTLLIVKRQRFFPVTLEKFQCG